ncbi:MAG: hypothetical protein AB7I52_16315 [Rhizobiaceae bacterium]
MPLRNRVDPFGQIHASSARGMFIGNRGIIHDPATKTLLKKRWSTPHWIICACQYKDRPPRDVMGYNPRGGTKAGWTELFFLDDVTALAAGHRPCFTCRRTDAKAYAEAFGAAFGVAKARVPEIDGRLHAERLASGKAQPRALSQPELAGLPDGAMVAEAGSAFAVRQGTLLRWSFDGYVERLALSGANGAVLLTPETSVAVLRAGFQPAWHPSAAS